MIKKIVPPSDVSTISVSELLDDADYIVYFVDPITGPYILNSTPDAFEWYFTSLIAMRYATFVTKSLPDTVEAAMKKYNVYWTNNHFDFAQELIRWAHEGS